MLRRMLLRLVSSAAWSVAVAKVFAAETAPLTKSVHSPAVPEIISFCPFLAAPEPETFCAIPTPRTKHEILWVDYFAVVVCLQAQSLVCPTTARAAVAAKIPLSVVAYEFSEFNVFVGFHGELFNYSFF